MLNASLEYEGKRGDVLLEGNSVKTTGNVSKYHLGTYPKYRKWTYLFSYGLNYFGN